MCRFSRDDALAWSLRIAATLSAALIVLVVGFLVAESAPALSGIGLGRLATDASWHPRAEAASGSFNILPIVVGTLLTSVGAILLAAPLGTFSAVFVQFYAPPVLARWYRRMIELMAGTPSVVFGLWGLVTLVPIIARIDPPGQSLLLGILVLALMILPTVTMLTLATLEAVPADHLQAAAALGLSRATTVFRIVVPAARSGIVTAVILAWTRALGETMAVLMVCGNVVRFPSSLFDPVRTLTATIALEMGYARLDHRSALFLCGLILLLVAIVSVLIVEALGRGRAHATT